MSTLYKLYCVSEDKVVRKWSATPLTECPHSSNHEIEIESVKKDEAYDGNIIAQEASEGYFETTHIKMNIPSGNPGDITEHDVTWPSDVLLWRTLLTPLSDMIGDELSVVAGPETVIGVMGVASIIGETIFVVNSTVTDNMWRGFLVTLDDGTNKDILGRCVAVNKTNSTITVETPATYAFNPMTQVKISVYILRDIEITDTNVIDIGSKGFKGKKLDAGTPLRVQYTNNSGTSKIFRWRPELYNLG